MAKPGKMFDKADTNAKVVRDLEPGMSCTPPGRRRAIWWQASDELGNEGWVPSTLFGLAK